MDFIGCIFEAKKYGISYRRQGRQYWYTVKCCECGKEFESLRYNHNHKYTCKSCKDRIKSLNDGTLYFDKEARFERAVKRIDGMVKNINDYRNAIDIVHKNLHRKGWFQSTEEVMVAIELIKNKMKIIPQQKIGRYRVDFAIPNKKILLEVDGKPFHSDMIKQRERDGKILFTIGMEWNIVRIPTDLINKDITKLLNGIDAVLNKYS